MSASDQTSVSLIRTKWKRGNKKKKKSNSQEIRTRGRPFISPTWKQHRWKWFPSRWEPRGTPRRPNVLLPVWAAEVWFITGCSVAWWMLCYCGCSGKCSHLCESRMLTHWYINIHLTWYDIFVIFASTSVVTEFTVSDWMFLGEMNPGSRGLCPPWRFMHTSLHLCVSFCNFLDIIRHSY